MTTTTCRGAGSRLISNARSRTTMPCATCGTYHAKVASVAEPGRSVTAIDAELATPGHQDLMVVKDTVTGGERMFKEPVPPVVPARALSPLERMGQQKK